MPGAWVPSIPRTVLLPLVHRDVSGAAGRNQKRVNVSNWDCRPSDDGSICQLAKIQTRSASALIRCVGYFRVAREKPAGRGTFLSSNMWVGTRVQISFWYFSGSQVSATARP